MRSLLFAGITVFIFLTLIFTFLSYISPIRHSNIKSETNIESPQSVLYFNPNIFYSYCSGETYTVEIFIKTAENKASEIQIELSYDPDVIYNVRINPSNTFFTGEKEYPPLLQEVRENLGRASLAIQRNSDVRLNEINLALLTFQINSLANKTVQINFLDKSAVFSNNSGVSLLKETVPLTIYCSKTNLPNIQQTSILGS